MSQELLVTPQYDNTNALNYPEEAFLHKAIQSIYIILEYGDLLYILAIIVLSISLVTIIILLGWSIYEFRNILNSESSQKKSNVYKLVPMGSYRKAEGNSEHRMTVEEYEDSGEERKRRNLCSSRISIIIAIGIISLIAACLSSWYIIERGGNINEQIDGLQKSGNSLPDNVNTGIIASDIATTEASTTEAPTTKDFFRTLSSWFNSLYSNETSTTTEAPT
ncbi:hypothetical protein NECID01_2187, partial [Nematocida sp. AWRm77]